MNKFNDGGRTMNIEELKEILEKHKKWLNDEDGGERANLYEADLSGANLCGANLRRANLSGSDLSGADLCGADLRGANLCEADLSGADLSGADLRGANLCEANLRRADLSGADLNGANLCGANLSGANLCGANLSGADLCEANHDYSCWPLWCSSLTAGVDDRTAIQLLYHTLSVVQRSPYVSDELKRTLLVQPVVDAANRFHHAKECGNLSVYTESDGECE